MRFIYIFLVIYIRRNELVLKTMDLPALYFIAFVLIFIDLKIPLLSPSSPENFKVSAFNIDEEYPIIITNKFNGKDSHFGTSVVLLSKPLTSTSRSSNYQTDTISGWVLIGAPKANSTNANHSQIHEPGLIWRCALGNVLNYGGKKVCEIVEMDPTGEYDPKDPNLPSLDRKDGGWLGGSMSIGKSDNFVTCASRWVNQKFTNHYLVNGICYWLPKSNLQVEDTSHPPNWPWLPSKLSYRLSPLLNKTKQRYNPSNYKDYFPENKLFKFDWAVGQFGFSLHSTPQNELIAGAVGVLDWTGSVVYYKDTSDYRSNFHRYNAHVGYSTYSEVIVARPPKKYLSTEDYFGYSVTSGKFFNETFYGNKTQFASGAPRSSYMSGKVLVFTINELQNELSEGTLDVIVEPLEGKETRMGNHYGSYFGYALLAVDVNNDGFDDLLVGAPLYGTSLRLKRNAVLEQPLDIQGDQSQDDEDLTDKMKSGDEGCVFLYLSDGKDFARPPSPVCGDKIPGSRFGTAISSLQDINSDGFNDVAIGAPYENDGRGAVYIYHGSQQSLLFAQKLQPEKLGKKIRTFGWSLSLGEDIDANGYPDLAVGAYETNQVVIFRTIPIVHFTATLTASIPKLLPNTDRFNLTSCISYNGHGKMPVALGIWVKLTIEVEAEGKRLISLVPDEGLRTPKNLGSNNITLVSAQKSGSIMISKRRLLLFRHDSVTCYNFTAFRIGTIDGLTKTVPIRKEYWIDSSNKEKSLPRPVHYVMQRLTANSPDALSVDLTSSKSEFADFAKNQRPLPAGNKIEKKKFIFPVGSPCEADGDPECLANLTMNAFLVDYKSQTIYNSQNPFVLGSVNVVTLTVELINHREVANLPVFLLIRWSQPLAIRVRRSNCDEINEKGALCSAQKPIKELHRETFAIELDMTKVFGDSKDRQFQIHLEGNTSSSLVQECRRSLSIPLKTQLQPQSYDFVGSTVEYALINKSIETFKLSQAFEIGLEGPSSASSLNALFEVPHQVFVKGKWHKLMSIRRPVVAYDGDWVCKPVNGTFFNETERATVEGAMKTDNLEVTISTPTKEFDIESKRNQDYVNDFPHEVDNDEENGDGNEDDVAAILLGKIRRTKRSITDDEIEARTFSSLPETLTISCEYAQNKNVLRCLKVSCTFSHFTPKKKAVVEFKLRMYTETVSRMLHREYFEEDFATLLISSVGSTQALDLNGRVYGKEGNLKFTSVLGIPPPKEIPAWIYIVSVAVGLLSLTLVIVILKKCGFFRRSKRDELLRQRALEIGKRSRYDLPGTSSTARIRTSTSSRHHRSGSSKDYPSSSSGNSKLKRKIICRAMKNQEVSPDTSPPTIHRNSPNMLIAGSSSLHQQIGSPTMAVKQREIPGAVDLNELRRLYAWADENEF